MNQPDEDQWRRRFVTIAVRDYHYEPDDFAARIDAQVKTVCDWLTASTLNGREFQHESLNPGTRSHIPDFVAQQRLDGADADDVLVLYITGHGVTGGSGNHYLVLPDSDEQHPLHTCYPTVDLLAAVLGSEAEHVLIIVDSCRAGALHSQWAVLSKDLPKARRELKTLTVLASADFDTKTRIGEFAELLRLVYKRLQGPAEITGRYLTVNELFTEIGSVRAQHPELGEPIPIWPLFAIHPTGSPCLPNPAYVPPIDLVDASRQQVSITKAELDDYWTSRASGRISREDPGWYFSGRVELMNSVVEFLCTGTGIQVITGVAGSGKSAILARAVTLSDPLFRRNNPEVLEGIDPTALPPEGCIDAAVLAREMDTEQFCTELLDLLGGSRSTSDEGAFQQLKAHLKARQTPLLIAVDGVDESTHPDRLITDVLAPLARLTDDHWKPLVRLLLGLRSGESSSPIGNQDSGLLGLLERAAQRTALNVVRTDETPSVTEDIGAYLAALLSIKGPYADTISPDVPVVKLVASNVSPSFLDARLAGDRLRDAAEQQDLSDPVWLSTLADGTISLFSADLADTAGALEHPAAHLLAVLQATAFARGRGVPWADIWPTMAEAIFGEHFANINEIIEQVLHTRLAGYLTLDVEDGRAVHRPNHARLAEALRDRSFPVHDEHEPSETSSEIHARIARALAQLVERTGLVPPHPYLARHLIDHAHRGRVLDDAHVPAAVLPWEPGAKVRGLLGMPPPANASSGRLAAWASIEPYLGNADISSRRMSLAFAAAGVGLPLPPSEIVDPFTPTWAHWQLPPGNVVAASTYGPADSMLMAGLRSPNGRVLLATAGSSDGMVRVWDPIAGTAVGEPWHAHDEAVSAVVTLWLDGERLLLIAGSETGMVRVWDPIAGTAVGEPWRAHEDRVNAMTVLRSVFGHSQLITAGGDERGTLQLWDPLTGDPERYIERAAQHAVGAMLVLRLSDRQQLLVTGGAYDGMVRIQDAVTGRAAGKPIKAHDGGVTAIAVLRLPNRRPVFVTGSLDGTVRMWNPVLRTAVGEPWDAHEGGVSAMVVVRQPDGPILLATAGRTDGMVRLWDPVRRTAVGDPWCAHGHGVSTLIALPARRGQPVLLASGGGGVDRTVRLWDPLTEATANRVAAHDGGVSKLVVLHQGGGRVLLASGGGSSDGTVRLWDPITGTAVGEPWEGHEADVVTTLVALRLPGKSVLLATGGIDGVVRLWNPFTGTIAGDPWHATDQGVSALVTLQLPDGRVLLAAGDSDGMVQVWDPLTATAVGDPWHANDRGVSALVTLHLQLPDGRPRLATGGVDGMVRVWDPLTATAVGDPWHANDNDVSALVVLPQRDGGALLAASGGVDGIVAVWNPVAGAAVGQRWHAHDRGVSAMTALPLGGGQALLASGGPDNDLRFWNPADGSEIARIVTGRGIRSLVTFTEDAHRYLVVGGDGGIACCNFNGPASSANP
jgi:WD40 repeat protein